MRRFYFFVGFFVTHQFFCNVIWWLFFWWWFDVNLLPRVVWHLRVCILWEASPVIFWLHSFLTLLTSILGFQAPAVHLRFSEDPLTSWDIKSGALKISIFQLHNFIIIWICYLNLSNVQIFLLVAITKKKSIFKKKIDLNCFFILFL